MSNEKHYPLHPNQSHPPVMTCEIPLEEYESLKRENAELKAKLENVQATAYTESVDAGMRERRLRRALLLVCAKRADAEAHIENNLADLLLKGQTLSAVDFHRLERDKWYKRAVSCRAKAEEYK